MRRGSHLLVLLLVAGLVAGCTDDADDPGAPATRAASYDGPASLANPLGTGLLGVDQDTLAGALIAAFRDAGGMRATVRGGPYDTVVEVDPSSDPELPDGRRFTWRQDGVDREQLHLPEDRVCVNRASAEPLRTMVEAAMHGTVTFGDQPYSCTEPSSGTAFLTQGLTGLDPLVLLDSIDEWSGVQDLGLETDPDGVTTRHLHLDGASGFAAEPPVPWDVWLDGDLQATRTEYGDSLVATFEYGPVPPVELPPAGGFGLIRLVFFPVGSVPPVPPAPTATP